MRPNKVTLEESDLGPSAGKVARRYLDLHPGESSETLQDNLHDWLKNMTPGEVAQQGKHFQYLHKVLYEHPEPRHEGHWHLLNYATDELRRRVVEAHQQGRAAEEAKAAAEAKAATRRGGSAKGKAAQRVEQDKRKAEEAHKAEERRRANDAHEAEERRRAEEGRKGSAERRSRAAPHELVGDDDTSGAGSSDFAESPQSVSDVSGFGEEHHLDAALHQGMLADAPGSRAPSSAVAEPLDERWEEGHVANAGGSGIPFSERPP